MAAKRLVVADVEDDIREYDRLGLTIAEQATRLGVGPRAVQRARQVLGLVGPAPVTVEITPEIDALLKRAEAEGWSRDEAARTTGISPRRLRRLYPNLTMPPVERGFAGALARQENRLDRGQKLDAAVGIPIKSHWQVP